MTNHEWAELAACQYGDPDSLFVQGAEQNKSKRICNRCPVKQECLGDALDNRIEWGVWGGMTERERRALLRRHPDVASWRRMFAIAEAEVAAGRAPSTRRTLRAGFTAGLPLIQPAAPLKPARAPAPARNPAEKLLELIRAHAEEGVWIKPSLNLIRDTALPDTPLHSKPHLLLGQLERSGRIKVFWDVPIQAVAIIGEVTVEQLKDLDQEYGGPTKRQKNAA